MRTGKITAGLLSLLIAFSSSALATTIQRIGPDGGAAGIVSDPRNPNVFFAESGPSLFKTIDGGNHWATVYQCSHPNDSIGNVFLDPADSSILYARIYSSQVGSSKFCKSTDGGYHWTILPNQPPHFEVTPDPRRSGVFYSVGGDSVFRTMDGGLSWVKRHQFPLPAEFDSVECSLRGIDPARPETIYVAVAITENGHGEHYTENRIEKSEDGGSTWTIFLPPTPCTCYDACPFKLFFDPGDSRALYFISDKGELFLNRDGDAAWRKLWDNQSYEKIVCDVAFGPVGSGLLFVGTSRGLFKSADNGATWTNIGNGLPDTWIVWIRVDPRNTSTILVRADWTGMFKTTDGGASWVFSSSGLRGEGSAGYAMAIAPSDPSILYVATFGGLYKSANRGTTWDWLWQQRYKIIISLAVHPQDSSILYAHRTDGIAKSLDGGRTWNLLWVLNITYLEKTTLVIDPVHPETVYAGTSDKLFKTTDGGAHWISLQMPARINCLVIDPNNPAVLYIGPSGSFPQSSDISVFKSTDGGSTWAKRKILDKEQKSAICLTLDSYNPRIIYAGTHFGIYKSLDGGETWALVLSDLNGRGYADIAVGPSSPSVVYALYNKSYSQGCVFRSLDGGTHWEDISRGENISDFLRIVIDPSDSKNAYFSGGYYTDGVYALKEGFPWLAVNRIRLDFGAAAGAPPTQAQGFNVFNAGEGDIHWTATANQSWIHVSPTGGTNGGTVQVSVDPQGLVSGPYSGSITLEDPHASNPPQAVAVILNVYGGGGRGA